MCVFSYFFNVRFFFSVNMQLHRMIDFITRERELLRTQIERTLLQSYIPDIGNRFEEAHAPDIQTPDTPVYGWFNGRFTPIAERAESAYDASTVFNDDAHEQRLREFDPNDTPRSPSPERMHEFALEDTPPSPSPEYLPNREVFGDDVIEVSDTEDEAAVDDGIAGNRCNVCYAGLINRNPTAIRTCGHVLCRKCILNWFGRCNKTSCPVCREYATIEDCLKLHF